MKTVGMYFEVHQPIRIGKFSMFGEDNRRYNYFDDAVNRKVFEKVSKKCYLPANETMLNLINKHSGAFRISYSITGTWIEQAKKYAPHALDSFRKLVDTGCVDLLGETYYHSLASLYEDKTEFIDQIKMHKDLMNDEFGYNPKVFRNTEVIYDNNIAKTVENMGYKGIITEGADHIMGWKSPNHVYNPKGCASIKLLMRNYKLSDDVAFRFSAKYWKEWPLTSEKYANWLSQSPGQNINLFMDYETFGEHQWEDTGIFAFLNHVPEKILQTGLCFNTLSEIVTNHESVGEIDIPLAISWADLERDTSAWLGNPMQHECFRLINEVGTIARKSGGVILDTWRKLQTSDNLYYLSTKGMDDGDVHGYFSHFNTPYDAFINYMNVLSDFKERLLQKEMVIGVKNG